MGADWLKIWLFIGWRFGCSLVGDVVTHWLEKGWIIGMTCGSSLVGDEVDHWFEMWVLIGWRYGCSLVEDGVGSLVGDVVANWYCNRLLRQRSYSRLELYVLYT